MYRMLSYDDVVASWVALISRGSSILRHFQLPQHRWWPKRVLGIKLLLYATHRTHITYGTVPAPSCPAMPQPHTEATLGFYVRLACEQPYHVIYVYSHV